MNAVQHSLNGLWDLSFTMEGQRYRAKADVPGNVEPVLQALGLVEDYMPCDDLFATEAFTVVDDWTYATAFTAPPLEEGWTRELVMEGVDTIAEAYLNGEKICDLCDMHMTWRADVTDRLREGENELKIVIRSSELWARKRRHDVFSTGAGGNTWYDSQSYLRKARHQWGWDNAPRLLTAGVVRPVYLEDLPPRRLEDVYLYTRSVSDESVTIGVNWAYATPDRLLTGQRMVFTLLDGDEVIHREERGMYHVQSVTEMIIPREKVELWWPVDYGTPRLYTMRLEVVKDGQLLAGWEGRMGIRTLWLDRTPDIAPDGTGEFVFRINGQRIFARGTNWKPLSPLASEAHRKTAQLRALEEARALHCNMIRIWGGGIYEDHAFFDYCDRNGIMVWQDFMFACEIPPTDDDFCQLARQEAVQVVKKLRNHPSLAVWCGDNEDDMFLGTTPHRQNALPSDIVISHKVLRDVVVHYDSYRCFVESSPFYTDASFAPSPVGERPIPCEIHLYPNTARAMEKTRECKSIFIGEAGPILINSIAVNARSFEREKARMRRLWNGELIPGECQMHQADSYFVNWRRTGTEVCMARYGRDFAFDEWPDYTIAVNFACAEVFKDMIEYCRVTRWKKSGLLWWSLMDMWPMAFNYSVIDSDFNRKLAWYWIRQSQQAVALMGVRVEMGGELAIYAVNDTLKPAEIAYTVRAVDQAGNTRPIASGWWKQAPNAVQLIHRIAEPDEPQLWLIEWEHNGQCGMNHVFTGATPFPALRTWIGAIGKCGGFDGEILELKQ